MSKSRSLCVQKPRLLDVFLFPVPKPPGSRENLGFVSGTSLAGQAVFTKKAVQTPDLY